MPKTSRFGVFQAENDLPEHPFPGLNVG